jgi:hypothetical protein
MGKICKIAGCNRDSRKGGMCAMHYQRVKRYNDPGGPSRKIEKHGMWHTKVYSTWRGMKQRCSNPNVIEYPNYGGRGIVMCADWRHSFLAFYRDIGNPPSPKHEIDRINNDGNYEPGNCRWVTHKENGRNKRTSRLNEEKAIEIRELKKAGHSVVDIMKKFHIAKSTVKGVLCGSRWKPTSKIVDEVTRWKPR